ncbi:MAG TPA: hypothetical protein VEV17_17525 [Bryobacteraceae bacterium]|nr:hypothetical protein [Bryobacteraceae bacterium]
MRIAIAVLLLVAAVGARRLLFPQSTTPGPPIPAPATRSFLVILGIADKLPTVWNGSITATGASILNLEGWRFTGADAISGPSSWKLSTHNTPALTPPGPLQENGVIVTIPAVNNPVTFAVTTPHGNFSFSSEEVAFGTRKTFLGGRALATETGAALQLTSSDEEEDFPSITRSGDDVYLVYTRFVHGDRSLAQKQTTPAPITDFSFLARPTGMDQVLLLHYSVSQQTWTGPFAVTDATEDVMRTAVAVDGQGRAWVFYSTQRSGNFDIYARFARADGSLSPELQLTSDPGTDLFPVAVTDASGRVWVAWQGFRNNNLEVLASAQIGDTFTPETIVSTSQASDWDPAIAAAPNGEVAISWDTYDKGDYDVYLRRARFTDQIGLDDPIAIAASSNFEARSSLAYDPQNRLWIAYEFAGSRWGKDFGAYDTSGLPLYSSHTIQVRCLIGNDLYSTNDDVANTLPGIASGQFFQPTTRGPFQTQPDPTLAQNRAPNSGLGPPAGPRNSFPRLATDSDGTVYLFFRELAGAGLSSSRATGGVSVGSIWMNGMVYYDGAVWHGPGVLAHSDAVGDNRPSSVALGPGQLLIAQSSDHRLSPLPGGTPQKDGVNSDIYATRLQIAKAQQSPQLQEIGAVTPDPPDPAAAAEAAAAALSRSYRPTVSGRQYQLLRGDFHRHSEISFDGRNDGPLTDSYRYYIDAASLGWAGCCDHDNGEAREYSWWITQKFTDAYLLGSKFVPMFYYERSISYPEGHRNVLFAQRGIRPLPRLPLSPVSPSGPAPDTNMLYNYLHFFGGISAPHTSATDQGTDWRNNDAQVEPFVEIYQGDRQNYEMPGAPRSNTRADSISGYDPAGYVSNALAKGYQLGFEASSDHVSTHISFTNIWSASTSRADILDALHKRRLYGSTDNILADFRSGTHFMGEAFTTGSAPAFTVRLWGTAPFQSVVVVKDNNIVYSPPAGTRAVSFTWRDETAVKGKTSYYYVRGVQTDGQVVWVSPMWVTLQ